METKQSTGTSRFSRKLISVLLVLVLTFNLLPLSALAAPAQSGDGTLDTLAQAIKNAVTYGTIADCSISGTTVTDTSKNSSIWTIAVLLRDVYESNYSAPGGNENRNPNKFYEWLTGQLSTKGVDTGNASVQALLKALVGFGGFTNYGQNKTTSDSKSLISAPTITVTVKRDKNVALQDCRWDSLNALANSVDTTFTYKISSAATYTSSYQKEEGSGCNKENVTYYVGQYCYITGVSGYNKTASADTSADVANLEAYVDLCNDVYAKDPSSYSVANLYNNYTAAQLADMQSTAATASKAVSEVDADVFNFWLTVAVGGVSPTNYWADPAAKAVAQAKAAAALTAVNTYIANCNTAYIVKTYEGTVAELNTLIADRYNAEDRDDMVAVQANAKAKLETIEALGADNTAILATYANYDKAAAEQLLTDVFDDINKYDIRDVKKAIDKVIDETNGGLKYAEDSTQLTEYGVVYDLRAPEDEALKTALETITASKAVLDDTAATFTKDYSSYVSTIFDGNRYDNTYISDINWELAFRNVEADKTGVYDYFTSGLKVKDSAFSTNYVYLLEDASENYDDLKELVNKYKETLGEAAVNDMLAPIYAEEGTLLDEIEAYIAELYTNAGITIETETKAVLDLLELDNGEITIGNYALFETYYNSISKLYTYIEENNPGALPEYVKNNKAALEGFLAKYDAFMSAWSFSNLQKKDLSEEYPVRLGSDTDYARHAGEDFAVTKDNLGSTIDKFDDVLASDLLPTLLGTDDANLQVFVKNKISEMLFSDDILNKIFAMLYPALTGILDDLGPTLIEAIAGDDPNAAHIQADGGIWLDIGKLAGNDDLSGSAVVYLDQNKYNGKPVNDFVSVFEQLGLYVYPTSLAKKFANDPILAGKFDGMGRSWEKYIEEGSDEVVFDFEWGLDDENLTPDQRYELFCTMLGKIFEPVKPILGTLFGTSAFSGSVSNAAFGKLDVKYKALGFIPLSADNVAADVGMGLTINALNGYKSIWIPLLEALGLNAPDDAYAFDPITGNESTAQMVTKLIKPVFDLIDKIAEEPIDHILSILPDLAYIVSFDGINKLINEQNISLSYSLSVDIDEKQSDIVGKIIGYIKLDRLIANILNKNLEPMALNVGEILDLGKLLGCDFSDINSVVRMLVHAIGVVGLDIPIVDPAQLITCGTPIAGASSARLSGTRNYIKADVEDTFFVLFNWILDSLANKSLINGILALVADGDEDAPELTDGEFALLNALANDKDKAMLAIVELLNPQEYELSEIECFNNDAYSQYVEDKEIEGFNAASATYLANNTSWTKEKAQYVVNNIEKVFEAVLLIAGADKADIEEFVSDGMETIFTNDIISYVVEALVELDGLLDVSENVVKLLKDELGFDFSEWNTAFGYIFDEDDSTDAKGEGFEALNYVQNEETGEFAWELNGKVMNDGDKTTFISILTYLVNDLRPFVGVLLNDQDFSMLEEAITLNGNNGYKSAIVPLFEALGIPYVADETYQVVYAEDQMAGLEYIITAVFDKLDDIVKNPASELVEMLPNLVYFLEGNGLSVVLKNLLHPILVLVDVVMPLASDLAAAGEEPINLDIDALLKGVAADLLDEDSILKAEYLDALSVNDLRLEAVLDVVDKIVKNVVGEGFEMLPVLSPALRTFSMTADGLDAADSMTVVMSALLETLEYGDNARILDKFLIDEDILPRKTAGILNALTAVFNAPVTDMLQPDWVYTFRLAAEAAGVEYPYGEETDYFELVSASENGALDLSPFHTINYLNYEGSDWNYEAAQYLSENLDDIVLQVLKAIMPNADPEADSIDDIITELNFYSAETIDKIAELLKDLIGNLVVEDAEGVKNTAIVEVLDEVLGTDIMALLDFDASSYFVADDGESDRDSFVRALKDMLTPAAPLLDVLFLGKDIEYFDASGIVNERKAIITIHGAEGYAYGLVPMIEALGGTCKETKVYYNKVYDLETGDATCTPLTSGSSAQMISDVIDQACAIFDKILAEPADTVLSMLPNLLYFVNSGGLTAAVNNTIRAVSDIADTVLGIMGGYEIEEGVTVNSLNDIVKALVGIDLSDLSVDQFIEIIRDMTTEYSEDGAVYSLGLDLSPIADLLKTFFIGKMEYYVSANGEGAFRMVYNAEEDKADMLTILISFVIETIKFDPDVAAYLDNLLGTDGLISKAIECYKGYEINYLNFEMQDIGWYGTEYADTDYVFNLIETTEEFSNEYGPYFTEEMAKEMAKNFDEFLDAVISLLGVQIGGKNVSSLPELLDALVGTTIYTPENVQKILDVIAGIMQELNALPAAEHVKVVLKQTLGVDLTLYDKYIAEPELVTNFAEGDRDAFVEAVKMLLNPVYPVMNWLLCDEDISFFVDSKNNQLIKIYGAEGYKYGIIPVLEALMCENVLTADEYYAAIKADPDAVFDSILNPLLDKIDQILADPANEALEILPNIIYFVNSNGLDTCWKNILHAVYGLLNELKPVVDVDLYELLGIKLDEMTFDSLVAYLFDIIEEKTGYQLNALLMDEIAELTTGKLVSFESANGEKAYRMIHSANSEAQLITAIMRIAVKFVVCDNNAELLKNMLKENENVSEDAYNYYCSVIDIICDYAQSDSGIDSLLYLTYYIYNGVSTGVISTNNWLKDFNSRYQVIYNAIVGNNNPTLQKFAKFLKDKLGLEDIVSDKGIAPNGVVKFVSSAVTKLTNAVTTAVSKISTAVSNAASSVKNTLGKLFKR